MKINGQQSLAGFETFWLIPAAGAQIGDVVDKGVEEIRAQATITLEVRKDSIRIQDDLHQDGSRKTMEAFYPGGDQEAENNLVRISRREYFILAKDRHGDMYLLNTSPTEFRYRKNEDGPLTGESGFSIQVETEGDGTLVKVLTLSLNYILEDSNFDTLTDSNGDILRS